MQKIERFTGKVFGRRRAEKGRQGVESKSMAVSKLKETEDPSENLDFLFAPGKIEELVREGRIPLMIGMIGSSGEEMQPYYQVPPRGYDPKKIHCMYMAMGGAYAFVRKDGSQKTGSTYTLTEKQAQTLEERVAAEKERLNQSKLAIFVNALRCKPERDLI